MTCFLTVRNPYVILSLRYSFMFSAILLFWNVRLHSFIQFHFCIYRQH